MFHFDLGNRFLYHNRVCTLNEAKEIDKKLDEIYQSNIDWGGFALLDIHYLEKSFNND